MMAMSLTGGQWGADTVTVPGTDASAAASASPAYPSWIYVGAAVIKDGDTSQIWNVSRAYVGSDGTQLADLSTTDGYSFSTGVPISSLQPVGAAPMVTAASATSPAAAAAAAAARPYYKKPVFWAIAGVATVATIGGIALAVRAARR